MHRAGEDQLRQAAVLPEQSRALADDELGLGGRAAKPAEQSDFAPDDERASAGDVADEPMNRDVPHCGTGSVTKNLKSCSGALGLDDVLPKRRRIDAIEDLLMHGVELVDQSIAIRGTELRGVGGTIAGYRGCRMEHWLSRFRLASETMAKAPRAAAAPTGSPRSGSVESTRLAKV